MKRWWRNPFAKVERTAQVSNDDRVESLKYCLLSRLKSVYQEKLRREQKRLDESSKNRLSDDMRKILHEENFRPLADLVIEVEGKVPWLSLI